MRASVAPGEEIRLLARPHMVALVRPLARPLVLALGGGALVVAGSRVAWALVAAGAAVLAAAALLALAAVWRWDRTRLVLTTEKLFVVHGIARRRAAAVRLARVPALEYEQGPLGRLLGYGTLVAGDFEVPYVPGRDDVRRVLG
jgi:membrane protein YdbS with pleckstrin-like domain